MTNLSYAAFQTAARNVEADHPLQVVELEGRVQAHDMPERIRGALIRCFTRMPLVSGWQPVRACASRMAARNAAAWHEFERALHREFGEAAARFAIAAVRTASAATSAVMLGDQPLTSGAVRLTPYHLNRHPEALRRYSARVADRSSLSPARKFETKPPALAARRGDPAVQLNAKVRMAGDLVVCRHLAMLWELEFLSNDGKVPYEKFETAEAIRRNVPLGLESVTKARQFHSPQCLRIVVHADWGSELVRHFVDMERQGETLRTIYVMSNGYTALHAMMLGLKIRTDARAPDRRGYVIDLYDPNMTATHVRSASADDPQRLVPLKAEDFFARLPTHPAAYYDFPASWFSCPAATHWTHDNRIPDDFLVPFALWAALRTNHADLIEECRERFKALPTSTQGAFLLAQVEGTSGLFWALHKGHAEAIRAWGGLLAASRLSADARAELLEGRHADGDPGARFASPQALAAWDEAIDAACLEPRHHETLRALRTPPAAGKAVAEEG